MLRHLPGSFLQRHPILRCALDTYYGCLQSSYICGYKEILKTTDSLISGHSALRSGQNGNDSPGRPDPPVGAPTTQKSIRHSALKPHSGHCFAKDPLHNHTGSRAPCSGVEKLLGSTHDSCTSDGTISRTMV
ncbi:uncharacterized protein LOC117152174, partial [Bombus impatiens]|uniref:Uncharacterized protein LOC117152174 n=1 Tax=Bombus impatiens TaxID=132113 RepID=A0A6P8L4N5_BOMIM